MRKKGIFIAVSILFLAIGAIVLWSRVGKTPRETVFKNVNLPTDGVLADENKPGVEDLHDKPVEVAIVLEKTMYAVPFTSQAPTGEWGRSEFQNGCEEASALMVWAWWNNESLTKEQTRKEIVAMARFQEKRIGQGIDTDAKDTAAILLGEYFKLTNYWLVYDFTLDDLKQALREGVIIVPTNGQALKNPNFTRPGPFQHMLVITGYDVMTKEFITNDPGTRKGEGYRYAEDILYAAIREYPTGKHLPIKTARKAMIVIPAVKP
jgi:hypothetical protein